MCKVYCYILDLRAAEKQVLCGDMNVIIRNDNVILFTTETLEFFQ